MTFRPAIFDSDVLSFDIAKLTQSLAECVDSGRRFTWRSAAQEPDHRYRRLLGACCKRPRRRAADQRDEVAPFHVEHRGLPPLCAVSPPTDPCARFSGTISLP